MISFVISLKSYERNTYYNVKMRKCQFFFHSVCMGIAQVRTGAGFCGSISLELPKMEYGFDCVLCA